MTTAPAEVKTENFKLVYYCKDCEKIVEAKQIGKRYAYKCAICDTKNVAFGTEKSIRSYYHVEESKPVSQ